MNTHHVELFYYVAKHKGIIRACRQMPYGIQQPAVSAQIISLEKSLGVKLFHRKPFSLTPAGEKLYDFAAPFFGNLDRMEELLKGTLGQELRIAGSPEMMRDHMPALIGKLKNQFPHLKLKLLGANQATAEKYIEDGEADLAITAVESTLPPGFRHHSLIRLPLLLLAPTKPKSPRNADSILNLESHKRPPLIALPPRELLTRLFLEEIGRRRLNWTVHIEASSVELITQYVRNGMGVGLCPDIPGIQLPTGIRALPLTKFPQLPIAAYWRGTLPPIAQDFLDRVILLAKSK